MKRELIQELTQRFESAAYRADEVECWYARDLQILLHYTEWRNFLQVVEKAKIACQNAGQDSADHFVDVGKMVDMRERSHAEHENENRGKRTTLKVWF